MIDNRDNLDVKHTNYRDVLVSNSREWSGHVSSLQWIMYEWFMRQVKKAEAMYRRAIAEKSIIMV